MKVTKIERQEEIKQRVREFGLSKSNPAFQVGDVRDKSLETSKRPMILVDFDTEWNKTMNEKGTVLRAITSHQFTLSWKNDSIANWKSLIDNAEDGVVKPIFGGCKSQQSYLFLNVDKKDYFLRNYKPSSNDTYDKIFTDVLKGNTHTIEHPVIGSLIVMPYSESGCEYGNAPIIEAVKHFCPEITVIPQGEKAKKASLDLVLTAFFADVDLAPAGRWVLAKPDNYKKAFDRKRKLTIKRNVNSCLAYNGGSVTLTIKDPNALMQGGLLSQLTSLNISQTLKETYELSDKRNIDKALCEKGFYEFANYAMGDTIVLQGLYYKFYTDLLGIYIDEDIQYVVYNNNIYNLKKPLHYNALRFNDVHKESTGAIVATILVNMVTNFKAAEMARLLNKRENKDHYTQDRNVLLDNYFNRVPIFTEALNLLSRSGNGPLKKFVGGRGVALTKTVGGLAANLFPFCNNGKELLKEFGKIAGKNKELQKLLKSAKIMGFDNDLDGAYAEVIIRSLLNLGDNRQVVELESILTNQRFLDTIRYVVGSTKQISTSTIDKICQELLEDWIKNDKKYITLGLFRKYIEPNAMRDGFSAMIDTMEPLSFDNQLILSTIGMDYTGLQQATKRELFQTLAPIKENIDFSTLVGYDRVVDSPESKMIAREIVNGNYNQGIADVIKYQTRTDTRNELDTKIGVAVFDIFLNTHQTYDDSFIEYDGPMDADDPRQSQNRVDNETQNATFIKYVCGNIIAGIEENAPRYKKFSEKQKEAFKKQALRNLRKLDGNNNENRYIVNYYPVNMSASLGDIFMRNAVARRKRFPKGTPENTSQKLINNTAYGVFASVYFNLISNAMMGNTITGKVRTAVRLMSVMTPTTQEITDGGPQLLIRVKSWDSKHQRPFLTTDVFKDGVKTEVGQIIGSNVKFDEEHGVVTDFDPNVPYMVMDGIRYEGVEVKNKLAAFSQETFEMMFPNYANICTSHKFEYKKIFNFTEMTYDGVANQSFNGTIKGSKRRGSEGGKGRYTDENGQFLDIEPVIDIHIALSGDLNRIVIPLPVIKEGILSYKESGLPKFIDRHTGESYFKLESGRIQPTRPNMKNVTTAAQFNALNSVTSGKFVIGMLVFGIRFDIEDELVFDMDKYNKIMRLLIKMDNLKTEKGKYIDIVNPDKIQGLLIKHKPYLKWVNNYWKLRESVDRMNGLHDLDVTDKLPKRLVKAVLVCK